MRTCKDCGADFLPKGNGYRCAPCRRIYERAWRARRKAEGNPVKPRQMPAEYHRAYASEYKNRPGVKERKAERMREYRKSHGTRQHHLARWKVSRAIKAGSLTPMPCEVCGAEKTHAHHDDYNKPLEVRWLCPPHHREHHAKAGGAS